MNVCWPVGVPAHQLQQIGRRTAGIDGVLGRLEAVEPELALLVGLELAPKVVAGLVLWVKDIVLAVGAGLPHVKGGVWDAEAGVDVLNDTVEESHLAILGEVLDDSGAKVAEGGLG